MATPGYYPGPRHSCVRHVYLRRHRRRQRIASLRAARHTLPAGVLEYRVRAPDQPAERNEPHEHRNRANSKAASSSSFRFGTSWRSRFMGSWEMNEIAARIAYSHSLHPTGGRCERIYAEARCDPLR